MQVTHIYAKTFELTAPHEAIHIFFFVMYGLHVVKLTYSSSNIFKYLKCVMY